MKIQLPESFKYEENGIFAKVEDGVLKITPSNFEKIMYQLTYQIKGQSVCYYCHREFEPEKLTLDHIFPRDYGGISVPNNLRPCCKNCNEAKGNLLPWQFNQVRKQEKPKKSQLLDVYRENNMLERTQKGILIPEEWYEMREDYAVFALVTSERPFKGSRKYQRVQEMYETYGKICKPIVISQNRVVLDGFSALLVAKNLGIKMPLPFVTLENVFVI